MSKEFLYRLVSSLALIPIVFFCITKGSYFFISLIILSYIISCYEWICIVKNKIYKITGLIFLSFSYLTIFLIRNSFGDDSLYLFFLILLVCISTDLGGYIFGKILKGPKLSKISPNKTYAGMFGSFFLSLLVVVMFIYYFSFLNYNSKSLDFSIFIIVLLISAVSQVGDLTISYFKRLSNMKNTGNIIPGHGGILDRTDGMVFAFPFSYILLIFNYI